MFLLLPIKTDAPFRRRPTVNYALIAINVGIFIFFRYLLPEPNVRAVFELNGAFPQLHQFLTYAFLHADWGHLIGNMLFLYIFGNSLNDKLGHLNYLMFYLAGGIFAGAGYTITHSVPLVGASGAIAAVTTGFLVLYPRSNVLVLIWIVYFVDTVEFSSLLLIVFKMVLYDNVISPALYSGQSNVAYGAHLIGYLFGFLVPVLLLAVRALDRDQFDILALWSRIGRRRQFAAVSRQGPAFYPSPKTADTGPIEPRPIPEPVLRLREEIGQALGRYDAATAAEKYRRLIEVDPEHVLARKELLDIANQLMSEQRHPQAAEAYEKYLRHYPDASQVEQVQLLLGILYIRYLNRPDRALELLRQARKNLTNSGQITLCDDQIRRLENP